MTRQVILAPTDVEASSFGALLYDLLFPKSYSLMLPSPKAAARYLVFLQTQICFTRTSDGLNSHSISRVSKAKQERVPSSSPKQTVPS